MKVVSNEMSSRQILDSIAEPAARRISRGAATHTHLRGAGVASFCAAAAPGGILPSVSAKARHRPMNGR